MGRVKVKIVDTDQEWIIEVSNPTSIREVLERIGLSPEEYVVSRNGEVVSEDEQVSDGDTIILYPVVSGG
ncbi:MAG: MoaD/ThiS family protein [Crenarchaeota archaeon]|nr:MoaD/ThiS family protein [Thermoproteota archaeon]